MSYLNVVGKSSHSEQIKSLATFQSCVFVTFQLYSSTEIIIGKDTKLSFFLNKKIKNYHIWSTEIFINKDTKLIFLYSLNICFFCRSAGLSSESPQVSYVKVNLEQFSYVKVILDKVTRRSNLLNQMRSKNTSYLSVTLQLFWIKGACFGA